MEFPGFSLNRFICRGSHGVGLRGLDRCVAPAVLPKIRKRYYLHDLVTPTFKNTPGKIDK